MHRASGNKVKIVVHNFTQVKINLFYYTWKNILEVTWGTYSEFYATPLVVFMLLCKTPRKSYQAPHY